MRKRKVPVSVLAVLAVFILMGSLSISGVCGMVLGSDIIITGTKTTTSDNDDCISANNKTVIIEETGVLRSYGDSAAGINGYNYGNNEITVNGLIETFGNTAYGIEGYKNEDITVNGSIVTHGSSVDGVSAWEYCDIIVNGKVTTTGELSDCIEGSNDNTITLNGQLESTGDFSTGIFAARANNDINVSGSIICRGDSSTGIFSMDYDSSLNFYDSATIITEGDDSCGIFLHGTYARIDGSITINGDNSYGIDNHTNFNNSKIILTGNLTVNGQNGYGIGGYSNCFISGNIDVSDGYAFYCNPLTTPDRIFNSTFVVLNGASISGGLHNADTVANSTPSLIFGYTKANDNTADISSVDNSFQIVLEDSITSESSGNWDALLAGGKTVLNGASNTFRDLYIGAETFDGRSVGSGLGSTMTLAAISGAGACLQIGPGAVTVTNDLVIGNNSILAVTVNADGASTQINVNGTAYLDGQLKILAFGDIDKDAQYQILTANSISGTFDATSVEYETALMSCLVTYGQNDLSVQFTESHGFDNFSGNLSGNQKALGKILSGCMGNASGQDLAVLQALAGLSSGELEKAMDMMTPESVLGGASAGIGAATSYGGGQVSRMQSLLAAAYPSGLAGPSGPAGPESEKMAAAVEWQVWAQSFGSWVDQDSRKGAAGYESDTAGMIAGLDRNFGDFILGGAIGGSATDVESDGNTATTSQDSGHLGFYAATRRGAFEFTGDVSLALADQETKRKTALSQTAKGDTDSIAGSARVGISYEKKLEKWLLKPGASVRYTRYKQDGYTETGAGSLNLEVGEIDTESCVSSLGVEVSRPVGERGSVKLSAAWEHEFNDTATNVTSRLSLAGSDTFDTKGLESDPDRFVLGVGGTYSLRENVEIFADGSVTLADELCRYDAALGIRISF